MGVISKLKSLGSLVPKTYRTYTLYDFSTLVKFKIFIFSANSKQHITTLPAQINPDKISHRTHRKSAQAMISSWDTNKKKHEYSNETTTVVFNFNVVDEYEARTMGGKVPLDINIDEITIIKDLRDYSTPDYLAVLKWGPLEEVVRIQNVDCSYDSYSPFGEPLAAEVSVTFENIDNSSGDYNSLTSDTLVQAKKDSVAVWADLSASYAAAEWLPSIISNARNQESNYNENE